jgi:hypothetical protein
MTASRKEDDEAIHISGSPDPGDTSRYSGELVQGDYGSGRNHVFSEPAVAGHWRKVYEDAKYEGRHRFDPAMTWSAEEEEGLKRKVCMQATSSNEDCECLLKPWIDWRIMTWCWIMSLALDLNRRNINRGPTYHPFHSP